jgi:uracil-DNA glycosylase family 4
VEAAKMEKDVGQEDDQSEVSGNTTPERKHPLAKCEECPLNGTKGVATTVGRLDAKVALVGEAPSRDEVRGAEPFNNISGKLLDKVLSNYGLNRADLLITNTVLCRPTNGKPSHAAMKCCEPRLQEELKDVETIVTLGATAADAIYGVAGKITERRVGPAKQLDSGPYEGKRVVPTVHPAATMYSPDMFPHLVTDIGKVEGKAVVKWEPPTYVVFDEPLDAVQVLTELIASRYPIVALDIEVGVDKDQSFTHPKELLCVGLSYKANNAIVIGEQALLDGRVRRALSRLLEAKHILCHNGKFDLQVLHNLGIRHMPKLRYDSMLGSYALDERPGTNGLKYLAKEMLGAPAYDDELHRYIGPRDSFAVAPREVLYKYNAYDAALTFNLWSDEIAPQLKRKGMERVHDMLVHFSEPLMAVEIAGLGLNQPYMDDITESFLDTLDHLELHIQDLTSTGFNPRSPKQVKEAIQSFGWSVNTTDVEMLTNLHGASGHKPRAHDFFGSMLEYRKQHKLYSTYVKGARKRMINGRVYPTVLLHGTTTGRTACRNPNLQNVPRDSLIRRLYIPKPGNVFVQTDYKSAELRVMGVEGRDEWLRDLFEQGRDIHSEIARARFGDNFTKDQRVRAKAVVYGVGYGREAYSLAQEYNISEQEAQSMIDTLLGQMKGVASWRQEVQQQVLANGYLETHFGRKRRFWLITSDNKSSVLKEGLASIPQSTSSDITLHSLRALYDAGYDVRIPVHDSNMVECPEEDALDVAYDIKRIMEETAAEVYSDYIPFEADAAIGPSWGELNEVSDF